MLRATARAGDERESDPMGEASRRKRQRHAAGPAEADPRLASAIRELRETLVARARAIRSDIDDTNALARVHDAAATIQDLMGEEGEAAVRLTRALDRPDRQFIATAAALADALHPDPTLDEAVAAAGDEAAEDAAEQLMAFEELPLGSRIGAVVNDREIAAFIAAALTVMGPRWDPFDADPLGLEDIAAVTAGLAVVRATLLVSEAIADAERGAELRAAITVAATAITTAEPVTRDLLADDAASPAWLLARAFDASAAAPAGAARIVRRVGPQLPLAFAAGAAGAPWAEGLEVAELFAIQVRQLEEALAEIPQDGRREALDAEFVLAAFAAGRAWRHAQGGEWLDPWDVPSPELAAGA
jgi:hypothetical protein